MFDVNPEIIERALEGAWHSETLEHYQEEDEYYSLDLSSEKDARYAINRWLLVGWRNNVSKQKYLHKIMKISAYAPY